jgi:hypothetical protein
MSQSAGPTPLSPPLHWRHQIFLYQPPPSKPLCVGDTKLFNNGLTCKLHVRQLFREEALFGKEEEEDGRTWEWRKPKWSLTCKLHVRPPLEKNPIFKTIQIQRRGEEVKAAGGPFANATSYTLVDSHSTKQNNYCDVHNSQFFHSLNNAS